ncbi:hypothetical protein EVAR_93712_1 [Eumeta japonica]|uniref:Reverse transcriptase domain-containing protein n=1 Tax=Eumeta variegata TaxID=151549 RepID=A0A4C1U2W4_EUMVA|nr:hypothetical protein EVAR_93712_1 [Eumeta japonica]
MVKKTRNNSETSCIHVIRDDNGHLLNEENNVKERWKNYFKSIFACEDTVVDDNITATEYMIVDGNESEITMDEIMKALKRMKVRKIAEYYRVSPEMLRGDEGIVASLLYQLFNKGWKSYRVPNDWSKAVIVTPPLLKKKAHDRGVRQECIASPWLLNLFMDSCLLKEYECGLRIDRLSVKCLLYANDQVILVPSACGLQEMYELVKKPLYSNTRGAAGTYQEQTEKIIILPGLAILAPPRVYALCLGTGGTALFMALLVIVTIGQNYFTEITMRARVLSVISQSSVSDGGIRKKKSAYPLNRCAVGGCQLFPGQAGIPCRWQSCVNIPNQTV